MNHSSAEREVRLERLRPRQIAEAIEEFPAVYAAFGSIEWHGRQNPVGLDTLKANEQLILLARRVGGLVYPPVFLGSGGGHLDFPHTYMVENRHMIGIVKSLLRGFEKDGFRTAILLSGHYPNKAQYFEDAINEYRSGGAKMTVYGLIEFEVDGVYGDHAALYETSYMMHLMGDLVDLTELGPEDSADVGGLDERRQWMDVEFSDHPCYGISGIDPRGRASAELGRENTDRLVDYLSDLVKRDIETTAK
jgi:creatinine amidohydrolase